MFAFVAPAVTGFSKALSGAPLCRAPTVSRHAVSMKLSQAMPFMEQPSALDDESIPGNAGFDPLNFTSAFDIRWMQEAEIKHCRVAMLGVLGLIVQEVIQWPGVRPMSPSGAHDFFVQLGSMSQILLWVSFFEVFGAVALYETLQGNRDPGYFAFDPLGLGKNPAAFKRYQLSELKNGRLAMCAFGGLYHQGLVSHMGTIDQLTHFRPVPVNIF